MKPRIPKLRSKTLANLLIERYRSRDCVTVIVRVQAAADNIVLRVPPGQGRTQGSRDLLPGRGCRTVQLNRTDQSSAARDDVHVAQGKAVQLSLPPRLAPPAGSHDRVRMVCNCCGGRGGSTVSECCGPPNSEKENLEEFGA